FIAHWIDRRGDRINDFQRGFLPYVAMLGGVLVLLMLQKDLGTSVVMVGIFVSAYWAGGGRMRHVVLMLAGLLLAFIALTIIEPYRFARLTLSASRAPPRSPPGPTSRRCSAWPPSPTRSR